MGGARREFNEWDQAFVNLRSDSYFSGVIAANIIGLYVNNAVVYDGPTRSLREVQFIKLKQSNNVTACAAINGFHCNSKPTFRKMHLIKIKLCKIKYLQCQYYTTPQMTTTAKSRTQAVMHISLYHDLYCTTDLTYLKSKTSWLDITQNMLTEQATVPSSFNFSASVKIITPNNLTELPQLNMLDVLTLLVFVGSVC